MQQPGYKYIFTIGLVLFLRYFSGAQTMPPKLEVQTYLVENPGNDYKLAGSEKLYFMTVGLVNKSDSDLYYWVMSCEWRGNFIFSPIMILRNHEDCDGNFPVIRHIGRGKQELAYFDVVIRSGQIESWEGTDYKVGFVFLEEHR